MFEEKTLFSDSSTQAEKTDDGERLYIPAPNDAGQARSTLICEECTQTTILGDQAIRRYLVHRPGLERVVCRGPVPEKESRIKLSIQLMHAKMSTLSYFRRPVGGKWL